MQESLHFYKLINLKIYFFEKPRRKCTKDGGIQQLQSKKYSEDISKGKNMKDC
jgi:hypothetical protein